MFDHVSIFLFRMNALPEINRPNHIPQFPCFQEKQPRRGFPSQVFHLLQPEGYHGFSSVKTCLVTLVLAVVLCCTSASAKPSDGDAFDPVQFEQYKAKAQTGDAVAQCNLGTCYAMGEGVEKDVAEAVKWLRKSADQGDARGQCGLGSCYFLGEGVEKDAAEAVKWFRMAAKQGHSVAQYNLGLCYYRGEGVAKDEVEAYKWYLLAAAQGDAKAKDSAPLMELVLTPQQITEGKRRAENFKTQERTQP